MKKIIVFIFYSTLLFSQTKSIEERIDSVLYLMSIKEKVGQLVQFSGDKLTGAKTSRPKEEHIDLVRQGMIGSFLNVFGAEITRKIQKVAIEESRLKIPLIFGLDVIHGFKTTFPVPIAEASSWDPELVKLSARMQAEEASSVGVHWTFSPMVDIARDPRWGRIVEGSGEDPYLASLMSAARVKGYQGENLSDEKTIVACAKHYAAYGGAEGGRDYNTVDISERTLRDVYLPPFKSAVDAGVGTLMSSFNEIGGIPSSANKFLLSHILKNDWSFDGFVVSDWNSIGELINHGIATDLKHAAELGMNAGVDMDMEANAYINYLEELVNENKISIESLNNSVRRVLRIKFRLGLFDDPFKYCNTEREASTILNEGIKKSALEVAKRSIVLLKNKNILPLSKNLKRIAVIGPLANAKDEPLGPWKQEGDSSDVVTVLDGIKNKVASSTEILYERGCTINSTTRERFTNAVGIASKSDLIILCLGESRQMSGEARNRLSLDLPGIQEELVKEIHKTGKPIVVVLMNGRPLTINWINDNVDGILETWFLGIQAGNAIADVLFGDYNPSGKLPVTFPRYVGQVPIYYNHKNTGRPFNPENNYTSKYIDGENSPLYPFGYGLSYSTFVYKNLKLDKKIIKIGESIEISVDVHNNGKYDGEEVAQLYIRDLAASVTRPVLELKDFKKVFIKTGESQKINFTLSTDKLKFYDINMKYVAEPGKFRVLIGTNSANLLESEFEVK
jgi:beta-glucosidase